MDDRIKLSYFYGKEAEQYSFYKIPKLLFTDDHFKKNISGGESAVWTNAG